MLECKHLLKITVPQVFPNCVIVFFNCHMMYIFCVLLVIVLYVRQQFGNKIGRKNIMQCDTVIFTS